MNTCKVFVPYGALGTGISEEAFANGVVDHFHGHGFCGGEQSDLLWTAACLDSGLGYFFQNARVVLIEVCLAFIERFFHHRDPSLLPPLGHTTEWWNLLQASVVPPRKALSYKWHTH